MREDGIARKRVLLLTDLERHADVGLLLLRVATGAFLLYQSHDNVISAARMDEFVEFMRDFDFVRPDVLAPLSVYAQFLAGMGFVLGFMTRWLGWITAFNFVVAVWMVHWGQPVPLVWPAAILVFLGQYLGLRGAGRLSIDHLLERKGRLPR